MKEDHLDDRNSQFSAAVDLRCSFVFHSDTSDPEDQLRFLNIEPPQSRNAVVALKQAFHD